MVNPCTICKTDYHSIFLHKCMDCKNLFWDKCGSHNLCGLCRYAETVRLNDCKAHKAYLKSIKGD